MNVCKSYADCIRFTYRYMWKVYELYAIYVWIVCESYVNRMQIICIWYVNYMQPICAPCVPRTPFSTSEVGGGSRQSPVDQNDQFHKANWRKTQPLKKKGKINHVVSCILEIYTKKSPQFTYDLYIIHIRFAYDSHTIHIRFTYD